MQQRPVAPDQPRRKSEPTPTPLPVTQRPRDILAQCPGAARTSPEPVAAPPFEDGLEDEDEDQPAAVRADPAAVAEVAVEVVRELIVRMGFDAMATVRNTGNPVVIDITGDDLGLLIGRHGDTLSAMQYLVNAIVGRRVHRWCKVVIDVEHYRLRREDTLRALANRQAARVRQSRQEITLDPMPAAERRVVHMTLQNSPWVATHSVGEEPNRCVVISPRQTYHGERRNCDYLVVGAYHRRLYACRPRIRRYRALWRHYRAAPWRTCACAYQHAGG